MCFKTDWKNKKKSLKTLKLQKSKINAGNYKTDWQAPVNFEEIFS